MSKTGSHWRPWAGEVLFFNTQSVEVVLDLPNCEGGDWLGATLAVGVGAVVVGKCVHKDMGEGGKAVLGEDGMVEGELPRRSLMSLECVGARRVAMFWR
jgi:hypothetical protein